MLAPDYTNRFKKDYKRAVKRNYDIALLDAVVSDLINEIPLDEKFKDHALTGDYEACRECHIKPDWILIYQVGNGIIAFDRTGTHSDLFS